MIAAEIDGDFVRTLRAKAEGNPRIVIVHGDVREMRMPLERFCVVANIPFSITTPILEQLLEKEGSMFQRGALIVEKGAARRFTQNPPRDPRVIRWQLYFALELGMDIDRTHFSPPPNVDASILSISRREKPLIATGKGKAFQAFASYALREPRSMAGDAFAGIFTPEQLKRALRQSGIRREQKVASLTLGQWSSLFASMLHYVPFHRWPRG